MMDSFSFEEIFKKKILPAVTFQSIDEVLPVTEAFLNAGLDVIEIPFRTPAAEEAIELIRKRYPQMKVGAGTLLTKGQVEDAVNAGAQFGLSPGFNKKVSDEVNRVSFPFIPGVMTPSEMEVAYDSGFKLQKLFPAEQIGGISFLKAMQGPYKSLGLQFIPMGGVNLQNLLSYIAMDNVIAVGGSWLATPALIAGRKFREIELNVLTAIQQVEKSLNRAL